MNFLQAIIMGIVQGATEFLPVSSSGHLAIFEKLFGMNNPDLTFDILLHVGTLLAVFVIYFKDIKKLIIEGCMLIYDCIRNAVAFFEKKIGKKETEYCEIVSNPYRKFVLLVLVSTVPTGIIGYMTRDIVEILKTNLLVVGVCLLITACLLLISERAPEGNRKPKNISYTNAFAIGICQGFATLPGISRSGTTITAGLISGFDRKFAVKYSFIMSIPAIIGASIFDLKDFAKEAAHCKEIPQYIIGMFVAAVVGYICIRTLIVLIGNKKFKYFAYYCVFAGILTVILNFIL